jgi:hypothetical protein
VRALGIDVSKSRFTTCSRRVLFTSTTGLSPVTVTACSSAPTGMSALIVATNAPDSSIPSRLTVEKPGSEKVTSYVPGLRSTIRYWPVPSVTTVRTRSIKAGLVASTVTPGSTAPEVSLAVPVMVACAHATAGRMSRET